MSQRDLLIEVLRRFEKEGLLSKLIVIGSWCVPLYEDYFQSSEYLLSIRTRDVDFLIPGPVSVKVDIPKLLEDLGFVVTFSNSLGSSMKLDHPELVIEFLVPEKGAGESESRRIPNLGIHAEPIRYLNLLTHGTMKVNIGGIDVQVPHPVNFGLHKLIVTVKRKDREKAGRDGEMALRVLAAVVRKGEGARIQDVLAGLPAKWQKMIKASFGEMVKESPGYFAYSELVQ